MHLRIAAADFERRTIVDCRLRCFRLETSVALLKFRASIRVLYGPITIDGLINTRKSRRITNLIIEVSFKGSMQF